MIRRPNLTLISNEAPPEHETVGERVRWLSEQAQALARDHVRGLIESLAWTEAVAREIATGGSAYHHGSQELAQRIADQLESFKATLTQIADRN